MSAKPPVLVSVSDATVVPTGCDAPVAMTLPAVIERIVEAVQPIKIILFGSYAAGTPTPDSDVDLLVVLETTATRVERYARVSEALWPRPFPVDILVKTPAELRQAMRDGDRFITDILQHGQVVYEQPS